MPILLNRRAVGALGVDLRFKAGSRLRPQRRSSAASSPRCIAQAVKMQRLVEEDKRRLRRREHAPAAGAAASATTSRTSSATSGPVRQMYEQVAQVAQHQHDGADPRRVGHRQGADRPRDPLQLAAREEAVRQGELRGAARQPDRVGAVRLREGRLHRRRGSARRAASSWPKAARSSSTRSATST